MHGAALTIPPSLVSQPLRDARPVPTVMTVILPDNHDWSRAAGEVARIKDCESAEGEASASHALEVFGGAPVRSMLLAVAAYAQRCQQACWRTHSCHAATTAVDALRQLHTGMQL